MTAAVHTFPTPADWHELQARRAAALSAAQYAIRYPEGVPSSVLREHCKVLMNMSEFGGYATDYHMGQAMLLALDYEEHTARMRDAQEASAAEAREQARRNMRADVAFVAKATLGLAVGVLVYAVWVMA